MASNGMAVAADHEAPATRSLLFWGMVAGPFYLAVGLLQGLLREGFVFSRHPLSVLANGPGGWIQTANFLLTGLMVLTAAVGFRRALGRQVRAMPWLLGIVGAAMIAAAIFPADPVDGFPPGTPEGFPTSISTTGLLHFMVGALTFTCLGLSGLAGAWTMMRRQRRGLAMLSLLSGLAVLFGFFGGLMLPIGIGGIWFAVVAGWAWLAIISRACIRPSASSGLP
jgi:hypothetical membrane protein